MSIEPLEARIAPATLVDIHTVTYTDVDGDLVTIKTDTGILSIQGSAQMCFFTPQGKGELLTLLDLTNGIHQDSNVTITAVKKGTGNGRVDVGYINGAGNDFASVVVDGDLGKIVAGDISSSTPGIGELRVYSMGMKGLTTQGGVGDLRSEITGILENLDVRTSVNKATLSVVNAGFEDFAYIGRIHIGRDLIGGDSEESGAVFSAGAIHRLEIGGRVIGGSGQKTGHIEAEGEILNGEIGKDVVGGAGDQSGNITCLAMGDFLVKGSVIGGAGSISGYLYANQTMDLMTVRGNVIGGDGSGSGRIEVNQNFLNRVVIGRNLVGGTGYLSGTIFSVYGIGTASILGDVKGGAGSGSGRISANNGDIDFVEIRGSVRGGAGTLSGGISTLSDFGLNTGGSIEHVSIRGSLIAGSGKNSGSIRSGTLLGSVEVGAIMGLPNSFASITAGGNPEEPTAVAIGEVHVARSVKYTNILAGVSVVNSNPVFDAARIGSVIVEGEWANSSIAAGVSPGTDGFYGTNDDVTLASGTDLDFGISRINKIAVGSLVTTTATGDHYGWVADWIVSASIGKQQITLNYGPNDDVLTLGKNKDFRLLELRLRS